MSVHSDNCVRDAASPSEADAACAEMFETVTEAIQRGETLTDQQLSWTKRHGGLLERPDTAGVVRWLRDRQR